MGGRGAGGGHPTWDRHLRGCGNLGARKGQEELAHRVNLRVFVKILAQGGIRVPPLPVKLGTAM